MTIKWVRKKILISHNKTFNIFIYIHKTHTHIYDYKMGKKKILIPHNKKFNIFIHINKKHTHTHV